MLVLLFPLSHMHRHVYTSHTFSPVYFKVSKKMKIEKRRTKRYRSTMMKSIYIYTKSKMGKSKQTSAGYDYPPPVQTILTGKTKNSLIITGRLFTNIIQISLCNNNQDNKL